MGIFIINYYYYFYIESVLLLSFLLTSVVKILKAYSKNKCSEWLGVEINATGTKAAVEANSIITLYS